MSITSPAAEYAQQVTQATAFTAMFAVDVFVAPDEGSKAIETDGVAYEAKTVQTEQ